MLVKELVLPEIATIAQVHKLHEQLDSAFNEVELDEIQIKTSGVQKIDVAVVQLLCVFSQAAKSRNIRWVWLDTSDKLRQVANILKVETALNF